MNIRQLFLIVLCVGTASFLSAQEKPSLADSIALDVRFGPYRDKATAMAEDFKKLLNTELIITDSSGTRWQIMQYRVGWRRKEESRDIKTGVAKTIFTFNAETIEDSTRLTVFWQSQLKESLQSGETILFEDIIVKNQKAGKIRRAKPVAIKIM